MRRGRVGRGGSEAGPPEGQQPQGTASSTRCANAGNSSGAKSRRNITPNEVVGMAVSLPSHHRDLLLARTSHGDARLSGDDDAEAIDH